MRLLFFEEKDIIPTSMIDVSDGLASEILHICKQSGVGAVIEESKVPIHPMTEEQAIKFKINPITCALSGGEDYELLFTISPSDFNTIQYMPDVFIVGEIMNVKEGVRLLSSGGSYHQITAQGWNHFKP